MEDCILAETSQVLENRSVVVPTPQPWPLPAGDMSQDPSDS